MLLLHANEAVSTDRLVDLLWGETPPATAGHTIQVYVSNLRKILGAGVLVTRAPGYLVTAAVDQLDLARFESLLDAGRRALASGDPLTARDALRESLALWRGAPLADFSYEAFAQGAITRLDELRLVALEDRIESELQLGGHDQLIPELQELVAHHPLRERLRGQLMLALYRSGRQAEALEVFQETRGLLVEELGIEPGPALQQLERAVLQQDPSLEARVPEGKRPAARPDRSILVAAESPEQLDDLVEFVEGLAVSRHPHELILGLALPPRSSLAGGAAALNERLSTLRARSVSARGAAFTAAEVGSDVVRLASEQDVDLAVIGGWASLTDGGLSDAATAVLAAAPCDVALLFPGSPGAGHVVVPFGGSGHDWAALELGAWCALAVGEELELLGAEGDEERGRPDASRVLAHAALAVQQLAGVTTEPVLVRAGAEGILAAAENAGLVVVGLPDDWSERGLGATRREIVERADIPVVLVRRGLRPGGLAPRETLTHYTWSLSDTYAGIAAAEAN